MKTVGPCRTPNQQGSPIGRLLFNGSVPFRLRQSSAVTLLFLPGGAARCSNLAQCPAHVGQEVRCVEKIKGSVSTVQKGPAPSNYIYMLKITQLDHVELTVNSCVDAPFDCDALNPLFSPTLNPCYYLWKIKFLPLKRCHVLHKLLTAADKSFLSGERHERSV